MSGRKHRPEEIISHLTDGFQRHVAGAVRVSLFVLFEQDYANDADDVVVIGKVMSDHGV